MAAVQRIQVALFTFVHRLLLPTLSCLILLLCPTVSESCYFPMEYQGTFLAQNSLNSQPSASFRNSPDFGGRGLHNNSFNINTPAFGGVVSYSELTIEVDSIPAWGTCHKRISKNIVILKDSMGPQDCHRCFYIDLKTPNVLQIHSEGLARCYTREATALATCPTKEDVKKRKYTEIMLFRKTSPNEIQPLQGVFCPISGHFKFTYTGHNGHYICHQSMSDLSNCPAGNLLSLSFRQCNFPTIDTQFMCLGDWEGANGERYLALMDTKEDVKSRPKYRCGMYRKDELSGRVYVSLSSDSTCANHLTSPISGFESLILTPVSETTRSLGGATGPRSRCRFPEWIQGNWEGAKIESNTFEFQDKVNNYRTITSKCIMRHNSTPNDKFIVHSKTQCGEEYYSCIWMKRRSPNVLEFKVSSKKGLINSNSLCNDSNFDNEKWVTIGKKDVIMATQCPVVGDYLGMIPGAPDLCAKISSDCNNPDIMFYTVISCLNKSHVFEENEYRCLGSWEENGIFYTHTHRKDIYGHQCFAGKILNNGEEAFIKEAGENCIRGEDPLVYGMKIIKQASCPRIASYVPLRNNWVAKSGTSYKPTAYLPSEPITNSISPPLKASSNNPPPTNWYPAKFPPTVSWRPILDSSEINQINACSSLLPTIFLLIMSTVLNLWTPLLST